MVISIILIIVYFGLNNVLIGLNLLSVAYCMIAVCILMYWTLSVFLLQLMFSKLRQFIKFVKFPNVNSNSVINGKNNNNNNNNRSDRMNKEVIELIKRLTVLYTVTFISTLVVACYLALRMIYSDNNWDKNVQTRYIHRSFSIFTIIDGIVNCICLLFQNDNLPKTYSKYCKSCIICVGVTPCYPQTTLN